MSDEELSEVDRMILEAGLLEAPLPWRLPKVKPPAVVAAAIALDEPFQGLPAGLLEELGLIEHNDAEVNVEGAAVVTADVAVSHTHSMAELSTSDEAPIVASHTPPMAATRPSRAIPIQMATADIETVDAWRAQHAPWASRSALLVAGVKHALGVFEREPAELLKLLPPRR